MSKTNMQSHARPTMAGKRLPKNPFPVDPIDEEGISQSPSVTQNMAGHPTISGKRLPKSPFPVDPLDIEDQLTPDSESNVHLHQDDRSEGSSEGDALDEESHDSDLPDGPDVADGSDDSDGSDTLDVPEFNARGHRTTGSKGIDKDKNTDIDQDVDVDEEVSEEEEVSGSEQIDDDESSGSEEDSNEDGDEDRDIAKGQAPITSFSTSFTAGSLIPARSQHVSTVSGSTQNAARTYKIQEIPIGKSLSKQTLASKFNKASYIAFIEKHCPAAEAAAAKALAGDDLRDKVLQVRARVLLQQQQPAVVQMGSSKRRRDDSGEDAHDTARVKRLKTSEPKGSSGGEIIQLQSEPEIGDTVMADEEPEEDIANDQHGDAASNAPKINPAAKHPFTRAPRVDSTILMNMCIDLQKIKDHILKELQDENVNTISNDQVNVYDADEENKEQDENVEDDAKGKAVARPKSTPHSFLMTDDVTALVNFDAQALARRILRESLAMQDLLDHQGNVSKDNKMRYDSAKKLRKMAYGRLTTIIKKKLGGSEEDAHALMERYFGI